MIEERKLAYVAHPYAGKEKNKVRMDDIMKELVLKDKEHIYVSPIHNFGMMYFSDSYSLGLEICLGLLDQCDILILCDDWESSRGCIGEWAFAKAKGIKIYTIKEWKGACHIG